MMGWMKEAGRARHGRGWSGLWPLALLLLTIDCTGKARAERIVPLPLGEPLRGSIRWEDENWATFTVEVPEDAMVLTLKVDNAGVDLDLFARFGASIESYDTDPDHQATSYLYNDELVISRLSDPPLESGTYYVDVAYTLDTEPRIGKRRAQEIPFVITATLIRDRVDGSLTPDFATVGQTGEEGGWFRTYTVEVPAGAEALRVDLDGVTSDLDILARRGRSILKPEDADHVADSVLGRETLLIDAASDPPLTPGPWYVQIQDPYRLDTVPFTAYTSFSSGAPEVLRAIPSLGEGQEGLALALAATVEVATHAGAGSGTLLSPTGWVLTNYHVVEDEAGGVVGEGEVVVSLSLDPRTPPSELFRGRVVEADEELDLALVRIETGLYGQPLPPRYRFPYLERGNSGTLAIGDALTVVGFPGVGGLGSRVSVTLTRGIVAGFDTTEVGLMIKTDAEISPGNSGGAALDGDWRLVGVPSATVEDLSGNSQLGYIIPLSMVPAGWWRHLDPGGGGPPTAPSPPRERRAP